MTSKLELSSLFSAILELFFSTNQHLHKRFVPHQKCKHPKRLVVVNRSRRPPDPEYKDGLDGNWLTPHHQEKSSPTKIQTNTKETHRNIKETHRNTKEHTEIQRWPGRKLAYSSPVES